MNLKERNLGFLFTFIIIGGILGSAIGTLIVKMFPSLSIIKSNLTEPLGFNLEILSIFIRLNIAAIIGMITGIIIFRKV